MTFMSRPINCIRHLRHARESLRQGLPASALQALMHAQSTYWQACREDTPGRILERLRKCIARVEDAVYPIMGYRGRRAS